MGRHAGPQGLHTRVGATQQGGDHMEGGDGPELEHRVGLRTQGAGGGSCGRGSQGLGHKEPGQAPRGSWGEGRGTQGSCRGTKGGRQPWRPPAHTTEPL